MYAKVQGGAVVAYPYGPNQLMQDNPDTSFPVPMPEETLASYDVYPVVSVPRPDYDHVTQNCTEVTPTLQNGQWTQTWLVTPATPEEITNRTNEAAQLAIDKRDFLLQQSDWTQLPDAPVDHAAWAVYRQQLRDVPLQPGFPLNIVWPVQP